MIYSKFKNAKTAKKFRFKKILIPIMFVHNFMQLGDIYSCGAFYFSTDPIINEM